MSVTLQQLLDERARRVEEAIRLEVPDRVPVVLSLGYFPAKYGGITSQIVSRR